MLCRVTLTGNVIVLVLTSLVGPSAQGLTCLSAQAVLQRLQGECHACCTACVIACCTACVMHAALPEHNMHTGQLHCL